MKSALQLRQDWSDSDIEWMTETAIRDEVKGLSELLKNQDATPRQAERLQRLRRALERLSDTRAGKTS